MDEKLALDFKPSYEWSVKAFNIVEKRLGVNIKLHNDHGQFKSGKIFVFNHFARFETIIPQYLIHQQTGDKCRCVAAGELFRANENFANFLYGVGALPHDHPGLMPFLAAEIFRGRKVIVFPEGGMVKDRKVVDEKGDYSIYSPTANKRRKHHTGAAVIALTTELFKQRIISVYQSGDTARLNRWFKALRMDSIEHMLEIAHEPTLIIPANITFYPIRASDNILTKMADLSGADLKSSLFEELIVESNILFKKTDMDIRLGTPIHPERHWRWWERMMITRMFNKVESLNDLFGMRQDAGNWDERMFSLSTGRWADRLRDTYMHAIYSSLTINLSHITAALIITLVQQNRLTIEKSYFYRALYLAVKSCQDIKTIHLHRGLTSPNRYNNIYTGENNYLTQFLHSEACAPYITETDTNFQFSPFVLEESNFHQTRLENLIQVYANELAPVIEASTAILTALYKAKKPERQTFLSHWLSDETRAQDYSKAQYSGPDFDEINKKEEASVNSSSFYIKPKNFNGLGVILTHGLLASPGELYDLGQKLSAEGYLVMGVRLKGHGTSPYDLRECEWQDWMQSLKRAYHVMKIQCDSIALIGFSTGGALSLLLAAEKPDKLVASIAISAPIDFVDKNLMYVPLVHGINKLTSWIPSFEGIMPFLDNESENPEVNYRSIPMRALYELRLLVAELKDKLKNVNCPTLVIQGTNDPVVKPESATEILKAINTKDKHLHWVPSKFHGIIYKNIGDSHAEISKYLETYIPKIEKQPTD